MGHRAAPPLVYIIFGWNRRIEAFNFFIGRKAHLKVEIIHLIDKINMGIDNWDVKAGEKECRRQIFGIVVELEAKSFT